jgi:hypothetical protein
MPVLVDGSRCWVTVRVARPDADRRDAGGKGVRQAGILTAGSVMRDLDEVNATAEPGDAVEHRLALLL